MKHATGLLLAATCLSCAAIVPAAGQGILGPDFSLSATATYQSDYRFRGISQDDRQSTPQGSLSLSGPDGFYVAAWGSKVNWGFLRPSGGTTNPSYEIDLYGGKHTDLWGTDWNIEPYYYAYPDYHGAGAAPKASYFELIDQLSHSFGPLALTATWAWSPQFERGNGTENYVEGTIGWTFTDWFSVSGNFGHQWVQNAKTYLLNTYGIRGDDGDYSHFDAGGTLTYKGFSLDARWVGTDASAIACRFYIATNHACAAGADVTLSYTAGL